VGADSGITPSALIPRSSSDASERELPSRRVGGSAPSRSLGPGWSGSNTVEPTPAAGERSGDGTGTTSIWSTSRRASPVPAIAVPVRSQPTSDTDHVKTPARGHKYAIQISTETPHPGGRSSPTSNDEALTFGDERIKEIYDSLT